MGNVDKEDEDISDLTSDYDDLDLEPGSGFKWISQEHPRHNNSKQQNHGELASTIPRTVSEAMANCS